MNNAFQTKLRLLFIPYLLYCAGIVCIYTFLNWLLFTRLQLWLLKEEVKDLWVPLALPWIPLAIGYSRRLRLLKYREKAKSPVFGMILLLGFAIVAPLIIAQFYLSTAAGKLTELNQVNEITQKAGTRYYRIRDYIIDRGYTRTHFKRVVSGKYNQYLDLSLYIICPIYDSGMVPKTDIRHYPISDNHRLYFLNGSVSDSLTIMKIPKEKIAALDVVKGAAALSKYGIAGKNGVVLITSLDPDSMQTKNATGGLPDSIKLMPQDEPTKITAVRQDTSFYPLAWVGVKYYKEISNRLDADAKKQKITGFVDHSWLDYVQLPVKDFTYFDEIPYNDDYTEYQKAADNSVRFRPGSPFRLLLPKNEPFENRNGNKLPWIFGSFAIGAAVYLLILSFIPFDEARLKAWLAGHSAIGAIGTSSADPDTQWQDEKDRKIKKPLQ